MSREEEDADEMRTEARESKDYERNVRHVDGMRH